jgi:hypothetical protein
MAISEPNGGSYFPRGAGKRRASQKPRAVSTGSPLKLSASERKELLAAALRLKAEGLDPARILAQEADSEEEAGWRVRADPSLLPKVLFRVVSLLSPDALDSPSVRSILKSLRFERSLLGSGKRESGEILDDAAKAIAIKTPRGTPPRNTSDLARDRLDYGFYLRIRSTFAQRCRLKSPRRAAIDEFAFVGKPLTPDGSPQAGDADLEPGLSRQVELWKAQPRLRALMPADRAALALLELKRRRPLWDSPPVTDSKPVTDQDLEEAQRLVCRLKFNLRRLLSISRSLTPSR